jgi:uncharacterized surface anchored protein
MEKLIDIQKGQFNRCDPYKISMIMDNSTRMKLTNNAIVDDVRNGIATLIEKMFSAVEDM